MENEHANETAEESGLMEPEVCKELSTLLLGDAPLMVLLLAANGKLDAEMATTPCHQTAAALYAVKSALEMLEARDKDRAIAAKKE